jgi:hypothetical protein
MKGSNFTAGLLLICLTTAAWAASTATLTGRVADAYAMTRSSIFYLRDHSYLSASIGLSREACAAG